LDNPGISGYFSGIKINFKDSQLNVRSSGVGSCSKWAGYLSYQDTFVWRKLHSYGVTVKTGQAQPPSSPYSVVVRST